ncbi:hypothetical protein ACHAQH_001417 [Verticillium albo-atrum]
MTQRYATNRQNGNRFWSCLKQVPKSILAYHVGAWATLRESCNAFLRETDRTKQEKMTRVWMDNMKAQLQAIILTSSIICSVVAGSFSWDCFGKDGPESKCLSLARAAWYSAIAMSIASVASASQQLVALQRLSTHKDDLKIIRSMLAGTADEVPGHGHSGSPTGNRRSLGFLQTYLWQIPVMMLNGGLCLFFC